MSPSRQKWRRVDRVMGDGTLLSPSPSHYRSTYAVLQCILRNCRCLFIQRARCIPPSLYSVLPFRVVSTRSRNFHCPFCEKFGFCRIRPAAALPFPCSTRATVQGQREDQGTSLHDGTGASNPFTVTGADIKSEKHAYLHTLSRGKIGQARTEPKCLLATAHCCLQT